MSELWPWLVMSIGVVVLFAYRFWTYPTELYAPSDFSSDLDILEKRPLESRAPRKVGKSVETFEADIAKAPNRAEVNLLRNFTQRRSSRAATSTFGQTWMPMSISLLVLLSVLFVILSNNTYGDAQQKWAFGIVGTIIGYWFKR